MYSSPSHLQSNGQVEKDSTGDLKEKLIDRRRAWVEKLPWVLWAYQTIVKTPTKGMPYAHTYGSQVAISTEIGIPTYRIQHFDLGSNEEKLREQLDLLDEKR